MTAHPTNRTAVMTGPRQVEVVARPIPRPRDGEVLLRTLYSGISAGTEMNVYRGDAPQWRRRQNPVTGLFEATDEPQWTYPLTYGYAAVGRVEALGAGVDTVQPGQQAFTYTPHQEWTVVPADRLVPLPTLQDVRLGVLNANLNTALNGVLDARVGFGDVVVVSGLGVIGLLVTQLVRRAGARLVVGVDRIAHRRDLAKRFGADVVLDPAEEVAQAVRELSGNRGADVVIEVSGASAALHEAVRTAGYGGRVIAMSWYGGSFASLDLSGEFHHLRIQVKSSQVAMVNPELGPLWNLDRRQQLVLSLLQELELTPLLTHEFPLTRAADAYRSVDEGTDGLVQCLLTYQEPR